MITESAVLDKQEVLEATGADEVDDKDGKGKSLQKIVYPRLCSQLCLRRLHVGTYPALRWS